MKIVYLDRVDSTNEEAKRVSFCHGLCIVAKEQTGGKGRRGKSWLSKRNKGIYVSFVLEKLDIKPGIVSLAFGYATLKTLLKFKEGFYLKWPNDVYFDGKKIAGILPELQKDRLIVGIGINTLYSEEELSQFPVPATSLKVIGVSVDPDVVLTELYSSVLTVHRQLKAGIFNLKDYERHCPMLGKEIKVIEGGESYFGKALGIDREGALIVETESGIKRLFSAEVSVRECSIIHTAKKGDKELG